MELSTNELIFKNFSSTYAALLAQEGQEPRIPDPDMLKTAYSIPWSEPWFLGDRQKDGSISPTGRSVALGMITCGLGIIGAILHGLYIEHKQKESAGITAHIMRLGLHNGNKKSCHETITRQENETPHWLYHLPPDKAGSVTEVMNFLRPAKLAKEEKALPIDKDDLYPCIFESKLTGSQVKVYINSTQMICYSLLSKKNRTTDEIPVMRFGDYVRLNKSSLNNAHLCSAELPNAPLGGAQLPGAELVGANLINADLGRAVLKEADLREADLRRVKLKRADLRRAKLQHADLRGAKLKGAKLKGANLEGAKLEGADLRGVDLRGAINVPDLSKAITDDFTLLYHSVE